jgi:PKD repeat protein
MIDGSGTGACRIYEMVAGTSTQFGSTYTGLLVSAGTDAVYRLEASGSGATVTLTLYENNVSVISATDSTTGRITRAGVAALEFVGQNTADGSSLEIDDYEDGTLPYGGTPPTSNFSTSTSNLTVTLTDSSTAGTNPITSYDTDWGDSTTHMTTASGSHTYASAGTYTITHLVSDGTLTGTHSASVTVSSAPLAGISLSVSGKTVTATDTSVPGSNSITTYYWNWGDGNTSSTANPVHTYAAAGTYLVGHEVVDSIGKYSSTYADAVTQTSSTFSLTTNPGGGVASAAPLDVPDA